MVAVTKSRMDGVSISTSAGPGGDASAEAGAAKALVKGLALIDLVAASDAPLRVVDLVEASGLPRRTTLRLLDTLTRHETLRVDSSGGYTLGPRLAAWGHRFLDGLDLRAQASDLMQGLVDRSGETCFLATLNDGGILYVAVADSPHAVRPAARVGSRNPLHCTGIGKAVLSTLTVAEANDLLREPLERRTPNTITDVSHLHKELELTRERGYSIDNVENEDGVRCVAAAVRDHTGHAIAGLSVSAPAYRFSMDDLTALAPHVTRVAAELSARLGHLGTPDESTPRNEDQR